MSAASRLWRNAPVWRLCLVAALASTGLAVMYPPSWIAHRGAPDAGQAAANLYQDATPAPAHFAPPPPPPPSDHVALQQVPNPTDLSGVIPFAGRQLPLPPGDWKTMTLAQLGGDVPGQISVLVRLQGTQMTGLVQAQSPSPGSGAAGLLAKPGFCSLTNTIMRDVPNEPAAQNPLVHECWVLIDSDVTGKLKRDKIDGATRATLDRLEQSGVTVPPHMLMLFWMRSSETGWMIVEVSLPDDTDVTAAESRKIQAWVKHYTASLHAAYDGTLAAGAGK